MKIFIKYTVVLLVVTGILFLIIRLFLINYIKKGIETKVQFMQHCSFRTLQGEEKWVDEFDSLKPTVIIYFHTECEHCQYEASEIGKYPELLNNTNMIWITPDTSKVKVENFALKYHLLEVKNLTILLDTNNMFENYFGMSVIPSVYIYGVDKRLLKKFNGETKLSIISRIIK